MKTDGTEKARKARTEKTPLKMVEVRKTYKMIPVDEQTHARFLAICARSSRKQGAQVKVWVDAEFESLPEAAGESA
jgi:hypothetical protein